MPAGPRCWKRCHCGPPNRHQVETVLRHAWQGRADANEPAPVAAWAHTLAPGRDPAGGVVKAELRALTDDAIALGVFGVPSVELEGRMCWGLDALPMLRAAWFKGPGWEAAGRATPRVLRQP